VTSFFRAPAAGILKQLVAWRHGLIDGLFDLLAGFIFAKELLANEKHSYTEPVAVDVLLMPLAGADLLAILDRIAAERHSRTVPVAVVPLVVAQTLLDDADDLWLGKELV
jgi:hypothetical protein|tara:strand:+ start:627 stop:956 length:330 start_codon:yes stop_codon:yes gene_type:complete